MFSLIAKIGSKTVIFGQGNTFRTAKAAGAWNAKKMGVAQTKVVPSVPASAVWFDQTPEYAAACASQA
jgi:hypothetical protein